MLILLVGLGALPPVGLAGAVYSCGYAYSCNSVDTVCFTYQSHQLGSNLELIRLYGKTWE